MPSLSRTRGAPSSLAIRTTADISHSWEYGALTQAIIELDTPELTVFTANAFPPKTWLAKVPQAVLDIITPYALSTSLDTVGFCF